jgi:FdhD protein
MRHKIESHGLWQDEPQWYMQNHAMSRRPLLSEASAEPTCPVLAQDERGRVSELHIPAERPLTVYLDRRELVTLMTLGSAPEALTLGYLRNQRLVHALDEVASIQVDWDVSAAAVTTHHGIDRIEERTARKVVTTGCGQGTVFGALMDDIDDIALPASARVTQSAIYRIVDTVRAHPSVYKKAGSVHACALFSSDGDLLYFVEDVGRHNAVDTIAGRLWLDDIDAEDMVFYTTGRLTSEMVIKGAQMGIPFLMSRSGTTQMGHAVADRLGMALLARCSGKHFLLLTAKERVVYEPHLYAQAPPLGAIHPSVAVP